MRRAWRQIAGTIGGGLVCTLALMCIVLVFAPGRCVRTQRPISRRHDAISALGSAQASGLGHQGLESAADHFAGEWAYGIGQLREASITVAKQLEDGICVYGDCDTQLADDMRKAMKKS